MSSQTIARLCRLQVLATVLSVSCVAGAPRNTPAAGDHHAGRPRLGLLRGDTVEGDDFAALVTAIAGPEQPYADPVDLIFDFEADGDVDLQDVAGFQRAFDGLMRGS